MGSTEASNAAVKAQDAESHCEWASTLFCANSFPPPGRKRRENQLTPFARPRRLFVASQLSMAQEAAKAFSLSVTTDARAQRVRAPAR